VLIDVKTVGSVSNEGQKAIAKRTSVLVITPQYAPDLGPSAPIVTNLCEGLAREQYDVSVIAGFPHYGGHHAASEYAGKLMATEARNGVRVARSYVYARKARLWQRALYHGSLNALGLVNALRLPAPDVVIAEAPLLWSGLPLLVRSVWPRKPFIYVVQDVYPDIAVRLGALTNRRVIDWFERCEGFFYRRAAYISVLSEGIRETLCRKGVPEDKLIVIPISTDVDTIRPLAGANKFRQMWGLQDKFVVLFTANLGVPQGLDNVVRAAEVLRGVERIAVVFVGEGAAKPALEAMVRERRLSNVHFFPLQSREDVPSVFDLADVSLVSLRGEVVMEAVPSKTYSIMASGRPVIATVKRGTEVARLLDATDCGLRVDPGDPEGLAGAVLRLYENASVCKSMGESGRKYVTENCSREVATRMYCKLIEKLPIC
jgi:colanic acid biosynthesis glycosyl transferase WcaI